MEKLNKDELFTIAVELNLPSLLKFCSINKRIYEKIHNNDDIWNYKLNKLFPDYKSLKLEMKPSEIYRLLYFLKVKCRLYHDIHELCNTEILDLSHKNLKHLPKEIGQLKKLRFLYLSYNGLITIPKEICQLKNLERINLAHNKLNIIPKEIGQLNNLIEFYLSSNKLKQIPEEISLLKKLRELHLSNNDLKTLPKEIGSLSLLLLDIYKNKSIQIPKEITDNKNIRILY